MTANTVVFTAADGHVQAFPLQFLLERGAVLADHVNGEPIAQSMGGVNQLWCPGLPAKYFVRNIMSIDFEEREVVPELPLFEDDGLGREYANRPNISIEAASVHLAGSTIHFEGYADDYDKAIIAIEFSLDDGEHWERHELDGMKAGRWVRWSLDYDAGATGTFTMRVRAINEDGKASPIPATHEFVVV